MLFLFIIASGDVREQIEEPDPCSMLRIGREPQNLGTPCLKKYIKYCIFLLNFLLIPHPLRRCKRINRRTRPLLNASHWQGTPEPWHFVLEKIYLILYILIKFSSCSYRRLRQRKRIIRRTRPLLNASHWQGTPEPWHFVLEKIYLILYILIKFSSCSYRRLRQRKRIIRRTRPLLNASHWQGTPEPWHSVLEKIYYLFFSALAASIILFAWSCGTSSYLMKSIWKEPLACVIALRSIAYLNISE